MFQSFMSIFLFAGEVAQKQAPPPHDAADCTYLYIAIGTLSAAVAALFAWCKALSSKASEAEDKRAKFAEDMVRMLERQSNHGGS